MIFRTEHQFVHAKSFSLISATFYIVDRQNLGGNRDVLPKDLKDDGNDSMVVIYNIILFLPPFVNYVRETQGNVELKL